MRKKTQLDRCPLRTTVGLSPTADQRLRDFTRKYSIAKFDFVSLLIECTPLDDERVAAAVTQFRRETGLSIKQEQELLRQLRDVPPAKLRAALNPLGVKVDD